VKYEWDAYEIVMFLAVAYAALCQLILPVVFLCLLWIGVVSTHTVVVVAVWLAVPWILALPASLFMPDY
jgi:hypothetical protein